MVSMTSSQREEPDLVNAMQTNLIFEGCLNIPLEYLSKEDAVEIIQILLKKLNSATRHEGEHIEGSSKGEGAFKRFQEKESKIKSLHFNPRDPCLLSTASVDNTVKLWDIRKIQDMSSYLVSLDHVKGINSSYFSNSDGARLLTCDRDQEIRVYAAQEWMLETTINHPHKPSRHVTTIKV